MDSKKVGRRIKEARTAHGITQDALAQMIDLTPKYISNIECGAKTPTLPTFVAIANALGCDANCLLSDVLDSATSQESGLIADRLLELPPIEQRKILSVVSLMIDNTTIV